MNPAREFSRPVTLDPWPEGGVELTIRANEAECAALARRLGVLAVHALGAHARFEREGAGTRLVARIEAEVVQRCVVSLEPVIERVAETVERHYLPARVVPASAGQREVVIETLEEEPEPLEGGGIDLGEVVVEELALALDPYPRAEQAVAPVPPELARFVSVDLAGPGRTRDEDEPAET